MQKVDVAIVLVGAAALVATLLGVLTYDDGQHDYVFTTTTTGLDGQGPSALPVNGVPALFEWTGLPTNATEANATVEITWAGTALTGGTYQAAATFYTPAGAQVGSQPTSFTILPGPAEGSVSIDIAAMWGQVPAPFRGSSEDLAEFALNWTLPLKLDVALEGPGSPLAGQITFEVTAVGAVSHYEAILDVKDTGSAR